MSRQNALKPFKDGHFGRLGKIVVENRHSHNLRICTEAGANRVTCENPFFNNNQTGNKGARQRGTLSQLQQIAHLLCGRHGHCRRVVIDDHPSTIALCVDEAVPGRQAFALAVLVVAKGIRAGIDRDVAVDPNQLVVLKSNLVIRQRLEGVDHVVSNCFRVVLGDSVPHSTASCS